MQMPPRFLPKYATSVQPPPPREASGYRGYQGYDTSARAQPQSVAEILSSPLEEVPPDLAGLQQGAGSQRKIADLLTQRAMGRQATGVVDGLSQLGEAFLARGAIKKADTADQKYGQVTQELLQAAMQGGEGGKASLMQLLSGNPDAGLQYAIQANTPKPERDPIKLGANEVLIGPDGQPMASNMLPEKPAGPNSAIGKLRADLQAGIITPEDYQIGLAQLQRSGVNVNVNTGDVANGERPIIDKPPKDYQAVWDAESQTYRMEPIPGSAAAQERESQAIKSNTAIRLADQQFDLMTTSIDKAIEQADFWSAGLMAQATSNIGATPARNLKATLDTIMANIGFEKLQEMRETSPTGGALGNVTERELAFLQSVRGSLDQIQDPAQLRQVLGQVKQSLAIIHEIRKMNLQGNLTNSGERIPTGDASQATGPVPGFDETLLEFMTPEERALFEAAQ